MSRIIPTFLVGAFALATSAGCSALLGGRPIVNNKPKKYGSNEMNEAKRDKDLKTLEDMCMLRVDVSGPTPRRKACEAANELLTEREEYAKLAEICQLSNKGEKYEKWADRRKACEVSNERQGGEVIAELKKADCGKVTAAFDKARSAVSNLDKERRKDLLVRVAKKLVKCNHWAFYIEKVAHWGANKKGAGYATIAALAADGVDWEKQFFAYVKSKGNGELFTGKEGQYFLGHFTDYLVDNGKTRRCADYVPVADRVPDASFGPLNWFFRKAKCKRAVAVIAKRLKSDRPKTRAGACRSLGLLGSRRKHKRRLVQLAKTDPYYWLKKKDERGRVFVRPIKVYDVRDACAAAANKL